MPIDNNRIENAIRPFAIGQKNWLFSNTANGAKASAALYSLISTAKVNGLDAEKIPDRAVFKAGGNNIITVEGRKMKLSPDDAKLFYQLWLPLLNYVNGNYHVLVDDIDFTKGKIDPQDAAEVAHFLWERTEIIDDYLKEAELSNEECTIIQSWKKCISGKFIIERHLKKARYSFRQMTKRFIW